MMQVLLSMTGDPDAPAEPDAGAAGEARDDLLQRWFGPLGKAVNDTLKIGSGLAGVYIDALLHPGHALDYARRGIDLTAEAARLALMSADSPTRFKGTPRGVKRAAWTDRLPAVRGQGAGARHRLLDQRRADELRRRGAARLPARQGRPGRRGRGSRAGPGEHARPGRGRAAGQLFRRRVRSAAARHRQPDGAAVRAQAAHGRAQGLGRAAVHARAAGRGRHGSEGAAAAGHRHARQPLLAGADQRSGAAARPLPGGPQAARDRVLGAAVGRDRAGDQRPELRRRGAVRDRRGHEPGGGPGGHRAPLPQPVRADAAGSR